MLLHVNSSPVFQAILKSGKISAFLLVKDELCSDSRIIVYFILSPLELYYLSRPNSPLTLSVSAAHVSDIYYETGKSSG